MFEVLILLVILLVTSLVTGTPRGHLSSGSPFDFLMLSSTEGGTGSSSFAPLRIMRNGVHKIHCYKESIMDHFVELLMQFFTALMLIVRVSRSELFFGQRACVSRMNGTGEVCYIDGTPTINTLAYGGLTGGIHFRRLSHYLTTLVIRFIWDESGELDLSTTHTKEVNVAAQSLGITTCISSTMASEIKIQIGESVQIEKGYENGNRDKPFSRNTNPLFTNVFLTAMKADAIIVRRYDRMDPESTSNEAKLREISSLNPTFAYRDGKGGMVVLVAYDHTDGAFVPRTFGDLRVLAFKDGRLADKIFKRLALFSVQSYFYGEFDTTQDTIYYTGVKRVGTDGCIYVTRAWINKMTENRLAVIEAVDPELADRLRKQIAKTNVWHSVRIMTKDGLIKGDLIVVESLPNGASFMVYEDNRKDEIVLPMPDIAYFTMMPKAQGKNVRTNRQIITMLGEFLYGEDFIYPKQEFARMMSNLRSDVERGLYVPEHNDDKGVVDAIESIANKAHMWKNTFGSLLASRYLTKMVGEQKVKQLTPLSERDDDKKRRLPVPWALSYSIRSEFEMRHIAKKHAGDLPKGHVFIDPKYGIIVSREIFKEFMEIAGGGDLDDTVEVHFRIAQCDIERFGVKAGQFVAVCVRNPVGMKSDGVSIGYEYQIRPICNMTADDFEGQWGDMPCPILPVDRPLSVVEVDVKTEPEFVPAKDIHGSTYDFDMVVDNCLAMPRSPFGRFVNIMMAYAHVNLPFSHIADMEDVVDACQQVMDRADLLQVDEIVARLTAEFAELIYTNDIHIDYHVAKRIGLMGKDYKYLHHLIGKGAFDSIISFHKQEVAMLADTVKATVESIELGFASVKTNLSANGQHFDYRVFKGAKSDAEKKFGRNFNTKYASESERNEFGTHMAHYMSTLVNSGELAGVDLRDGIKEFFFHWSGDTNKGMKEKHLYFGLMFKFLVAALSRKA